MWQDLTRTPEESSDLYCHESLGNFDDGELSVDRNVSLTLYESLENDRRNQSQNGLLNPDGNKHPNNWSSPAKIRNVRSPYSKVDAGNIDNGIAILDDDDYMKLLQSDEVLDEAEKSVQHKALTKETNFSRSLLDEFTRASKSNCVDGERVDRANNLDVTASWISNPDSCRSKPHSNWSQTLSRCDEYEQQVPEMSISINDQSCLDGETMDVLVIKDDGMCDSDSGSELDWNSLTPPVPASPSDQKVPETELDLDFCGHIDYDNHLAPSSSNSSESFLSSPLEHPSLHHWYFRPRMALVNPEDMSHSESDQVVPVL